MRDAVYPIPGSNSSLFISGGDFTAACGSAPTPFGPEIPICTIPVNIDLLRLPRTGGSRSLFVADMDPSGPKMFFLGLIGNSGYANGTARYGLAQRFADRDWIPMPLTSAEVAAASVSRFTLSY
ncbi:MAG TPA: hypothetical protein ENJ09_12445 [Planctomycetes bacterium]|nr:hypothetical protein [Planctomycetota bacterium]